MVPQRKISSRGGGHDCHWLGSGDLAELYIAAGDVPLAPAAGFLIVWARSRKTCALGAGSLLGSRPESLGQLPIWIVEQLLKSIAQ